MNYLIVITLFQSYLACQLLIQKQQASFLIQSECKITKIIELDTDNNIDFTYLSDNQITILQELINDSNDYQFHVVDKHQKEKKQHQKIIPNTDDLKTEQDKVNEQGIQSRYKIVLDNLLYDIAAAFIKGFLLLLI